MKTIDHRFAWISDELGAVWRLDPRAVVGIRDDELFPRTAVEGHRHHDRMVVQTRRPFAVAETDCAGERRFETVKVPLLDDRGDIVGTYGCCHEVPAGEELDRQVLDEAVGWAGFSRVVLRAPPWLRGLRRALQSSFRQRAGVGEIMASAGVGPDHARRMFRRFYGCTPIAYRRHHRVLWGWERLLETDDAAGRIALAAGFADQSHFTRDFKREWGLAPGQARASDRTQ